MKLRNFINLFFPNSLITFSNEDFFKRQRFKTFLFEEDVQEGGIRNFFMGNKILFNYEVRPWSSRLKDVFF